MRPWYLPFAAWHAVSATASSAAGVLAMQSMLYAVGVGSGSVALAGAVNWVLKDGIGQLGGMLFASHTATGFDHNPQRWRLLSALALDAACLLEVATAVFPGLFLPMAAVANIGKNVAWLSASATRASIHQSASNTGALADVTAKSGSQSMAASTLGTGLGIALSPLVGSDPAAIAPAFLVLSAVHLGALLQSMRHVALRSVNEQRLEGALAGGAHSRVLLPEEVSSVQTQTWGSIMAPHVPEVAVNAPIASLDEQCRQLLLEGWSAAAEDAAVVCSSTAALCIVQPEYTVLVHSQLGAWAWVAESAPPKACLSAYMHALLLKRSGAEAAAQLRAANEELLGGGLRRLEEELDEGGWNTGQPLLEPMQRRGVLGAIKSALATPRG